MLAPWGFTGKVKKKKKINFKVPSIDCDGL